VKWEIEEKAQLSLTLESTVARISMDIALAISREAKLQVSLKCTRKGAHLRTFATCKDAHVPDCHARGSILLLSNVMHMYACLHARPWTFAHNEACMHRSGNLFSNVRGLKHTYKQDTLTNAHAHTIGAPFP
jgi:hypothetical protein